MVILAGRALQRTDLVGLLGETAEVADRDDALELAEAVEAQQWSRAVDLYGGAFLEAVHVDDAPDFDRWITVEDTRLRRLFVRACMHRAQALAKDQQWETCAEVAGRWLAAEPTSADAAIHRLNAVKAPATAQALTAALAECKQLRDRLAEEFDIGLDPAVETLESSIRAELPPVGSSPQPLAFADTSSSGRIVAGEPALSGPATTPVGNRRRGRARRAMLLAAPAVLLAAVAYGTRHPTTDKRPVLAVLAFENRGQAGDLYFTDGLTDEIRTRLTGISGLRVIGGPSVRQYRATTKSPREIARELGATYLLTGAVRWERTPEGRGRVRVSPELTRAVDQANVWAASVEGPLDDVFRMQAEVAERVASALDVTLHPRERRDVIARPTTNLAAYDFYLRGRAVVSSATTFSAADRQAIRREFERAVELDSMFAGAYTELAWAHLRDHSQAGDATSASVALAKFRAAARRAWVLDSTAIDTRLVHARDLELSGDEVNADRVVREAARDAPDNVDVLSNLADREWKAGRYEATISAYRRAMALEPRAVGAWVDLAGSLDRLYRYDEAIAVREREIEVTPTSDVAYAVQASSHVLRNGDTTAARQTLGRGSLSLPWVIRLPSGVAGIAIWAHALPASVLHARDTLTLAGYRAGAGGIAPELYHLMKLRHFQQSGRAVRARASADSVVALIEPWLRVNADAPWFFWWFSRRSLLAEAYATLGRTEDAARQTDIYVTETRRRRATSISQDPEQLCHALHNAAYVDAQIGRRTVAVSRLTEALGLPCGHRVSRALLRADPAWSPLRGQPEFDRLIAAETAR